MPFELFVALRYPVARRKQVFGEEDGGEEEDGEQGVSRDYAERVRSGAACGRRVRRRVVMVALVALVGLCHRSAAAGQQSCAACEVYHRRRAMTYMMS